jgi:hypothetical protein
MQPMIESMLVAMPDNPAQVRAQFASRAALVHSA